MKNAITLERSLIIFGLPLGLFGLLFALIQSPFLIGNNSLSLAISIDLLLTVPLAYLFLIRQTAIPKTTAIPVMILGILIGSYFLPKESQTYLALFKTWGLPVVEVTVLTFVIIKVRSAIAQYKHQKGVTPDFYLALRNTCQEILPKSVVMLVVTEIAVIYYGFINWKTRSLQKNEFTYHQESGSPALLGAFIFIIIIETFAFHILLAKWSIIFAWLLSLLSIYTALQVFGFARSLAKRPISVSESILTLRYGILNEANIPCSDIESIEITSRSVKQPNTVKLSPLGELESHNVVIRLNKENLITGLYGIKKQFKTIELHVDEPVRFKDHVDQIMPPYSE